MAHTKNDRPIQRKIVLVLSTLEYCGTCNQATYNNFQEPLVIDNVFQIEINYNPDDED